MARNATAPSRRAALLAAVAAFALACGMVLLRLAQPSSHSEPRPPSSSASERETASTSGDATPAVEGSFSDDGPSRDQNGAVRAAVAYATGSQRWLYLSDAEIEAAITEIATPAATSSLLDEARTDISTAREQLLRSQGPVWWLVRPLAWRVVDLRDSEARVSVWTITILSAAGVAAPQTEFLTVTLDLAWTDGAWRVDDVRDAPGPTPITGPKDQPWDAEPFDQALDGYTRIDEETAP
jgi:hypothetical protein